MLTQSQRRRLAEAKAAKYVARFRAVVERCDVCGRWDEGKCVVHGVARGNYWRLVTRGKPFACLLLCDGFRDCHRSMGGMPRERQLAYLYLARPGHFSIRRYNAIVRPMVCVEDVMREVDFLLESRA